MDTNARLNALTRARARPVKIVIPRKWDPDEYRTRDIVFPPRVKCFRRIFSPNFCNIILAAVSLSATAYRLSFSSIASLPYRFLFFLRPSTYHCFYIPFLDLSQNEIQFGNCRVVTSARRICQGTCGDPAKKYGGRGANSSQRNVRVTWPACRSIYYTCKFYVFLFSMRTSSLDIFRTATPSLYRRENELSARVQRILFFLEHAWTCKFLNERKRRCSLKKPEEVEKNSRSTVSRLFR